MEHLASYTGVASGASREAHPSRLGRRLSELDPVRLTAMLEQVPLPERSGVYRRLGVLWLFLTGFADRRSHLAGALRSAGRSLVEALGQRWYRQAARFLRAAVSRSPPP